MDAVYLEIRKIARLIVACHPQPDFYKDHPSEVRASETFYQTDDAIIKLRQDMTECLDDDFGHGMGHAEKVSIDAGTLAIIESRLCGHEEAQVRRNLLLAQCAGLLHDICRKEKSHAQRGAETARDILKTYPLIPEEVTHVCAAIRNHEAFTVAQCDSLTVFYFSSNTIGHIEIDRYGPERPARQAHIADYRLIGRLVHEATQRRQTTAQQQFQVADMALPQGDSQEVTGLCLECLGLVFIDQQVTQCAAVRRNQMIHMIILFQ